MQDTKVQFNSIFKDGMGSLESHSLFVTFHSNRFRCFSAKKNPEICLALCKNVWHVSSNDMVTRNKHKHISTTVSGFRCAIFFIIEKHSLHILMQFGSDCLEMKRWSSQLVLTLGCTTLFNESGCSINQEVFKQKTAVAIDKLIKFTSLDL